MIEKLWHFEGRMSLLRERSFPRVYSEIILQLGPRFREVDRCGQTAGYFPAFCFGGATTRPSVIEGPDSACCVIGIQLHATAAFQLLGFSPRAINDITISLEDAFGDDGELLAEHCAMEASVANRFAVIARFIGARAARMSASHPAVEWVSRELRCSQGRGSVTALRDATGLSKSRFVNLFREQTGFAPKHYARILRFRRSLHLLQQGKRIGDAALTAGYYDQAHLQNEFSEFAEMTPAAFVAAQHFPNSASLPE